MLVNVEDIVGGVEDCEIQRVGRTPGRLTLSVVRFVARKHSGFHCSVAEIDTGLGFEREAFHRIDFEEEA